jgi:hypothetical protein
MKDCVTFIGRHGEENLFLQNVDGYFACQSPADAQLISAAPDLLESLKDLVDDIAERFDMDSQSTNPGIKICVERARVAIAKATQ